MKQVYYPKSNKDISKAISAFRGEPFVIQGRKHSRLHKKDDANSQVQRVIDLSKFDKVLRFDGVKGEITVQAGCTLAQINDYVSERGYVLPSSPQFFGASAGSCAASPVHGYSRNHQCIASLMSRLKILLIETGDIFDVTNEDKDWGNVFFGRTAGIVYLEVTFDCVPDTIQFMSLRVESDTQLQAMLTLGGNDQQIITWYPSARKVSEISLSSRPKQGANYHRVTKPFKIYRYPSYQWFLMQLMLKRSRHLSGPANLLMPRFNHLNAVERSYIKNEKTVDVDLSMRIEDVWRFIEIVNSLKRTDRKFCVGFDWGGISAHVSQKLWDPAADIWIEMVGNEDNIRHVISRLKPGSFAFHTGKFVPDLE